MRIQIIILFSFITTTLFAQTNKIDSILNIMNKCKTDSCLANNGIDLYWLLIDYNIDEAFEFAIGNYEYFKQKKYDRGTALCAQEIANVYKIYGDYNSAIKVMVETLNLVKDNKNRIFILMTLAEYNRETENYEDALLNLLEARNYIFEINDTILKYKVNNRIAAVLFKLSEFEKSLSYADSSIYLARLKGDSSLVADNYEVIGAVNNYKKNYKEAVNYYLMSLKINENNSDSIRIQNNYSNLGVSYFKLKEYKKAIYYLEQSYNLCLKYNLQLNLLSTMNFLSEVYSEDKQFKKAYLISKSITEIRIKLFNEERDKEIQKLNKQYETEKRIKEIENQKNVLIRKDIINLIYFILFILSFSFLVFVFISRRKIKKTNLLLEKQKRDYKKLNQQIFTSKIKIEQQNIEVNRKNLEIKKQKDILEEKAVDLLVLNRELKIQGRLREGLTNMIVHDLKNPISNIISLSKNKEITFFAKEILTMVENILDVQKYEGIMMPLKKNEYSLRVISEKALKQVELLAHHKNIKIENWIYEGINVYVDEDVIFRVFVNLLSNSIKYTPLNGSVLLQSEVDINDKKVNVKIIDTGIGIKKDKLGLVFGKFKQIMAKKSGEARSSGLGLSFCKLAIKSHGGEINVDSVPGKYTNFMFNIDLVNETKPEKAIKTKRKINEIFLNKKDKIFLKEFYNNLLELEVYEISKLRAVINKINEDTSLNIKVWKKELEKAIFNCNFEQYKILINLINES